MTARSTFFVDRSLGKRLGVLLREAGATIELHDDHFAQTTPDSIWIPEVTARGWVILTKDKNIRRPRGEREDVLAAGAKIFTLTSGSMSGAQMAQTFIDYLADMERIAQSQPAPFVYAVGPGVFLQILPAPTTSESPPSESESS